MSPFFVFKIIKINGCNSTDKENEDIMNARKCLKTCLKMRRQRGQLGKKLN